MTRVSDGVGTSVSNDETQRRGANTKSPQRLIRERLPTGFSFLPAEMESSHQADAEYDGMRQLSPAQSADQERFLAFENPHRAAG